MFSILINYGFFSTFTYKYSNVKNIHRETAVGISKPKSLDIAPLNNGINLNTDPSYSNKFSRASYEQVNVTRPFQAMILKHLGDILFVKEPTDSQTFGNIFIYNITDPSNPRLINKLVSYRSEQKILCFDVNKDLLGLAIEYYNNSYHHIFYIYNISDINNITLISNNTEVPRPISMFMGKNITIFFYIDNWELRMVTYNITDPKNVTLISTKTITSIDAYYPFSFYYTDINVNDTNLFFVSECGILAVINISNEYDPQIISTTILHAGGFGVDVYENNVFVAAGLSGIKIYNASNTTNIKLISSFNDTLTCSMDLEILNNESIIVADNAFGLHILNISDLNNITEIKMFNASDRMMDIEKVNNTVFVADMQAGIEIYNASDTNNITLIKEYYIIKESGYATPGFSIGMHRQDHDPQKLSLIHI